MARHTQIVEVLYEDAARFMGERMQGTETAVDRLRAYMDANLEYLRNRPRQVAALTEIGPHLPTRSGQEPTSLREQEPVLDALTSILREGQESGELEEFDAETVAIMIRASIERAAQWLHADPPLDFETYRRGLLRAFLLTVTTPRHSGNSS